MNEHQLLNVSQYKIIHLIQCYKKIKALKNPVNVAECVLSDHGRVLKTIWHQPITHKQNQVPFTVGRI